MNEAPLMPRRDLFRATATLAASLPVIAVATSASAQEKAQNSPAQQPSPGNAATDTTTLSEVQYGPDVKLTVERRGQVALFGINRPTVHNRIDPEIFQKLARAIYEYDHDPTLRAAILFGHGANFSRGIDVEAYRAVANSGGPLAGMTRVINPLNYGQTQRIKPLIVAVHGATWNLAHELLLSADIRIAAASTDFGQDEASHGRFPGGGSTVRFVREAGWGNAMRYMLTGDHWTARDAYRMGIIQEIAETPQRALGHALEIANKIAACAPLGVQTTLASAHLAIDTSEAAAFSKLGVQYASLYRTKDFIEGRVAEAEGRPPVFKGE